MDFLFETYSLCLVFVIISRLIRAIKEMFIYLSKIFKFTSFSEQNVLSGRADLVRAPAHPPSTREVMLKVRENMSLIEKSDVLNVTAHKKSDVRDDAIHVKLQIRKNATHKRSDFRKVTLHEKGVIKTSVKVSTITLPFCEFYSEQNQHIIIPDRPSDMNDWSFQRKRKCPPLNVTTFKLNRTRLKYSLRCSGDRAFLLPSVTNCSRDVDVVRMDDPCLQQFVSTCCTRDNGVPNLVHYVWYFNKTMKFDMFANMLSVIRFVRPCLILFHGEYLPFGKYWDFIIGIFPNVLHVRRSRPLTIFGKTVVHHEHSGDLMRLQALEALGGIYLDSDYIVVKDLQPFMKYDFTLCDQQTGYMLNCFIMSKRNATFLALWIDGYRTDFRNDSYAFNSMFYNGDLARKHPDLIHVEKGTLCCWKEFVGKEPNATTLYEWPHIYGFHLYTRAIHVALNEWVIRSLNSTYASLLRHVVYGNKEVCA